ncbi:MAG: ATP-binding protein [Deltaproteobacteria bacterium]|nr:ATP-binding protein [Deltaproteobacteria bacterium]
MLVVLTGFGPASPSTPDADNAPSGSIPTAEATPDPDPGVGDEDPAAVEAPKVDPLQQRADDIRALIAGTLDPERDPASLFVVDLADPALAGEAGERLLALLAEAEAAAVDPATGVAEPTPDEGIPADASTALLDALTAYLRLGEARRAQVLALHVERRNRAIESREASSRRQARLEHVTLLADRLEAFLAGTLDLAIDPRPLLRLDLGDANEAALADARRRRWPLPEPPPPPSRRRARPPPAEPAPEVTPEPTKPDPLTVAETRLDGLRRQFLALSSAEQQALFQAHERRRRESEQAQAAAIAVAKAETEALEAEAAANASLDQEAVQQISEAEAEAVEAAAERERAVETARLARTEANRILAEERVRLLGIKEDQARYDIELNRRKADRIESHDRALEWNRRATELAGQGFGSERAAKADRLYETIRADLRDTRLSLREELRRVRDAGAQVPRVGEGLDLDLAPDIDRGSIVELRDTLLANEQKLTDLDQKVAWDLAQGLRDDVVLLNRTRLELLGMASAPFHDEITGFGPSGVDQVQREFDQISVELGFHALKLPRYKDLWLERVSSAPFPVFMGLMQVLAIVLVYWWWRRRSPSLILRVREWLVRIRPRTRPVVWMLSVLWYWDRTRRPLERLAALWVLLNLAGDLDELPELILLWILVRWVLLGLTVILLLDALAARENRFRRRATDNSVLRIHSLRVVGLSVIMVGLILGLTAATVGKGAIYSWVISTCWLLSVPVALYLVHRWRPSIAERVASSADKGPAMIWIRQQHEGKPSFFASTVSAVYLFVRGIGRWFLRRLSGLETTRRVLAYLFRREVAKRAAATATAAESVLERVDADCYAAFDPDLLPPEALAEVDGAALEQIVNLGQTPGATLAAVVGERGMGKSTFLVQLTERLGPERTKVVPCPEDGLPGLMRLIAGLTGDPEARGTQLAEALRELGPLTIAIDDAQRLIQPAVRGFAQLDAFTAFARDVGGQISWVVTVGAAAWHYLQRARADRVFFELVVRLPRWSEEQLGALIRGRCQAAGIDPSFDNLVVPRATDPMTEPEEDRTESSYYRLLWDFSRGNPGVALHAFRESLFVDPFERVVVRLFEQPAANAIESLSLPLLFVLRAIVQLELAEPEELVAATQLPASDISDALRFCMGRGYIESHHNGVRLGWAWYRTITTVLQRQHLLSAS